MTAGQRVEEVVERLLTGGAHDDGDGDGIAANSE